VYSLSNGWLMHDDQEAGTARFEIREKIGDEEVLNKVAARFKKQNT
jgi:hypothetical protein